MNIFDRLGKIYNEIDSTYAAIEVTARSKGYTKKKLNIMKSDNITTKLTFFLCSQDLRIE